MVSPETGGQIVLEPAQPPDGYLTATRLTLHAIPADGYAFKAWSGDVSSKESVTAIIINDNETITATFIKRTTTAQIIAWAGGGLGVIVIGAMMYFLKLRKR